MKKVLLLILFFISYNLSFAKTDLSILQIWPSDFQMKFYKILLVSDKDTLVKIDSIFLHPKLLSGERFIPINKNLTLSKKNELQFFYSKDSVSWSKTICTLDTWGDEKNINIQIRYNRIILTDIDIYRYYKSPDELSMISDWDEKLNGVHKYKIINNSHFTFHSLFNLFWGNVYKLNNGTWELNSIGGFCGTRGDEPDFFPGNIITSEVADYIGADYYVKEKGKYKYQVELTTGDGLDFGHSIPEGNPPYIKSYDIYEIEQFFEIK